MLLRLLLRTSFWSLPTGSKVLVQEVEAGEHVIVLTSVDCDRSTLYLLPNGTQARQADPQVLIGDRRVDKL